MTTPTSGFENWRSWSEGHETGNVVLATTLTAAIRKTIGEFVADEERSDVLTAYDIGNGHCFDFAEAVMTRIGLEDEYSSEEGPVTFLETDGFWEEMFVADLDAMRAFGETLPDDIEEFELANLLGGATHQWLVFDGRHYDASAPDGRDRFLDLPFFADQIANLRVRLSSASAPGM
jgi:hypothetical protein